MTEAEWLDCESPRRMLDHLRREASERKLRLFTVACCRRIWHLLGDELRGVVEEAERFADGLPGRGTPPSAWVGTSDPAARDACLACLSRPMTPAEAVAAAAAWHEAPSDQWYPPAAVDEPTAEDHRGYAHRAAVNGSESAARASARASGLPRLGRTHGAERRGQAGLVRDIFGDPFRARPRIDPAWLTPEVMTTARAIYDERAFGRMPALGDALGQAGCTDADILGHCRGQGTHVRGCWAVDAVLGRS